MNAAFLIMSSAALAGADPAPSLLPAYPQPAAPVVITTGAGCRNCGTQCNTGCASAPVVINTGAGCRTCGTQCNTGCASYSRPNLCDRIKERLAKKSCGCAPACAPACTPKPPPPSPAPSCAPAPCNTCDTCKKHKPGIFDKLNSWWSARKKHDAPCCDSCSGYYLTPTTPAPAPGTPTAPKEMPKPKDKIGNTSGLLLPLSPLGIGSRLMRHSPY